MTRTLFPSNPAELHHAYIVVGGTHAPLHVEEALEQTLNIRCTGNPDVSVRTFETLGIDDSRELVRRAYLRPVGTHAVVIVSAQTLTREAQNSLLKLFEEPPAQTHFFLCISNAHHLLPTLRSRMQVVVDDVSDADGTAAQTFLRAAPAQRFAVIEPLVSNKDVGGAERFLNTLEENLSAGIADPAVRRALAHIGKVRQRLFDRGAPLKALLESVVVVCP